MDQKKRAYGLILLLMFPLAGVLGMILVLINNNASTGNSTPEATLRYPTPAAFLRPTVTFLPVLDSPAPDAPLRDLSGNSFRLADFRGQVVIINFWATWCPPCVREMPALQTFAENHPEVVVLSITDPNDGQTLDAIQAFIDEYGLTDLQFGLDAQSRLKGFMGVVNLPTTYILDQDGVVRFRQIGEVTLDDLTYYLDELA
jgi:thiol-disulfide isomerase/thioredoxin